MVVFASLNHIQHHTRGVCLLFRISASYKRQCWPLASLDIRQLCWPLLFSFSIILPSDVIKPQRIRLSPRAYLHVVVMLWLMTWHKPTELAHFILFRSCFCFGLYGSLNCISFHKFSWQLSAFSLCSSSPISALLVPSITYIFMKVSLSLDKIFFCGWLGLKAPTNQCIWPLRFKKEVQG